IPIQCRWRIIEKWLEGISAHKIAKDLGISKTTVTRIFKRFLEYGKIQDLPSLCGRPRSLTIDDMKYLNILLKEKLDWYVWKFQTEMEEWKGQSVGYCTIWRAIHRLGYTHKQVYHFWFLYIPLL
ncbi:Homeodomain-like protein, partial [Glomus cerebriforme]